MKKYPLSQVIKVELAILGFRLLSYLPMSVLYAISIVIEAIIYRLIKNGLLAAMSKRYQITAVNLRLCFPEKSPVQQLKICRQNFRESILVYLNYGLLFASSPHKLRSRVTVIGLEQFKEKYVAHSSIVVIPHFCAFDIALNRVSQDVVFCSSYKQVDNYFYEKLRQARLRFVGSGEPSVIFPAANSLAPIIRAIKRNIPFFYLPDLDYGADSAVYIPFLGHPYRATLNTVPRIARLTAAQIYTCDIYRQNNRYVFEFIGPLDSRFDAEIATQVHAISRVNEERIRKHPEHYRWYFPIFNTQPNLPSGKLYQ